MYHIEASWLRCISVVNAALAPRNENSRWQENGIIIGGSTARNSARRREETAGRLCLVKETGGSGETATSDLAANEA